VLDETARFRVSEEGVEAAARTLYYIESHPGSVPGWTKEDAERFQPFMGTEPASETLKNIYRDRATAVLIAAGAY
jgi:hypothetical protein